MDTQLNAVGGLPAVRYSNRAAPALPGPITAHHVVHVDVQPLEVQVLGRP